MNFDIIYKGTAIESFTTINLAQAKKYVKQRYSNNGKGCALVWFENNVRKQETVLKGDLV
jgi:hypothetical protein